ncbi:MAG TPA: 1-(5-phosphoribosyl)-5-[(5-phosphoribosylamino)methylideneamino]imidazole-4-carboxamide isomerase [Candidatus Limnocylindrales bacterium]|nr:1-(5-phosphoribosyl)-5-[(5-phosphoribosylamino)methylideneamino]imidazole-4-carboxamide isomerase [Candidatus Limnocylindrales bacterium]
MEIIPAIDLHQGKCVRLTQGKLNQETVFSEDPPAMAKHWEDQGAGLLHVVDLDGAFRGEPQNLEVVREIAESVSIPIQLGGGLRTLKAIEQALMAGARRVILGTIAFQQPDFVKEACRAFPGNILVGIDARDGKVSIQGWREVTELKATDLVRLLEDSPIEAIIYTDTQRDGMLTGPNLNGLRTIVLGSHKPVIASGGISTLEDIQRLLPFQDMGVIGAIVGKALYLHNFNLAEAIKLARGK